MTTTLARREAEIDELKGMVDGLESQVKGLKELVCLLTEKGTALKAETRMLNLQLAEALKLIDLYESDDLK